MAFDLMGLMSDASKGTAAVPKYEQKDIRIENMIENPLNSTIYTTEDIGKLAGAIELAGRVLQNPVVRAADEDGKYMLISGHRRWLACKRLVSRGKTEFGVMHCLVENEPDELMQQLMLIYTNSTSRVLNDAEKMKQAEKATAICKELKQQNRLDGRVRDIVSEMLHESSTQLARYSAISKNLTNQDLREKFERGEIGISAAYEASKLSADGQEKLASEGKTGAITLQKVTMVKMAEQEDSPEWKEKMDRLQAHRAAEQMQAERNVERVEHLIIPKKCKVEVSITTVLEEKISDAPILNYRTTVSYQCQSGSHVGGSRSVGHFDTIPAARAAAITAVADTCKEVAEGLLAGGYIDTLPEKFGQPKWKNNGRGQWEFDTHRWFVIKAIVKQGMTPGPVSATYAVIRTYYEKDKEPTWYAIGQDYESEKTALQGVIEHVACMGTEYATVLKEYVGRIPEEAKQADREAAKKRLEDLPKTPKKTGEYYKACTKKMEEEGWENLVPCEQCTVSTCCEKCCKTCKEKCNAGQECRMDRAETNKKKAFAASVVRNDLVSRRDMHIGLADVDVSEGNTDGAENEKHIIEYYDKLIERVENDVDYYQGV